MELKKILILLILILLNTSVYAEITKPNKRLEPYDVVKIQLEALKIIIKMTMELNKLGYLLIQAIKRLLVLMKDLEL